MSTWAPEEIETSYDEELELYADDKPIEHKVHLLAQRDRYVLLLAPVDPDGMHREVESHVFACFADASAADAATAALEAEGLDAFIERAVAAVADPDLDLGDFGVDVWGDQRQLPAVIQQKLARLDPYDFQMKWRGIVPKDLNDATMQRLMTTTPSKP